MSNSLSPASPPLIQEPNSSGVASHSIPSATVGGRFDFDDGGVYVGGWQESKAHGHGVCTGPKSQGEYSGSWCYGFELSGVYKWPSGATYEGQWQNGKRHGLGVEYRGKWVYKGEWSQGYKGRYGTRASLLSAAKYEGTWANGLQDGYGSETYADGGTFQGQWLRGTRHGYGVRQSAAYGHCTITKAALIKNSASSASSTNVSMHSLDTDCDTSGGGGTLVNHKRDAAMRGGFILVVRSTAKKRRNSLLDGAMGGKSGGGLFKGLRMRKQRSTGDLDTRSGRASSASGRASSTESGISGSHRGDNEVGDAVSNASFLTDEGDIQDPATTETYMGEWKNDKRCGFGICERSDGIRYEGEWYNNKKYGYGVTTMRDGYREEGKYKNNVLVTNMRKKHLFLLRSSKTRERIEAAVQASRRSQEIALQKADIAISRTATARGKAEQADVAAVVARQDSQLAFQTGKLYGGAEVSAFPDVPLRRKMSSVDFGVSMRLGRRPSTQSIGRVNQSLTAAGSHSGPKSQFLDPGNMPILALSGGQQPQQPFGGRRGSFRNHSDSLSGQPEQQPQPPQYNHLLPPQSSPHQHHNQQQQLNVPSLSFEPATPDPGLHFPVPLSTAAPPARPLRPSLKMPSSSSTSPPHGQPPLPDIQFSDPRYGMHSQLQQQQQHSQRRPTDPRVNAMDTGDPYQQQQRQQYEQMRLLQQQQQQEQQYQQMEAERIRRQQFSHQQQQQQMRPDQQVFQQQQQQQYHMQMQQQAATANSRLQHPQSAAYQTQHHPQRPTHGAEGNPFADHFDHYSALVNRYQAGRGGGSSATRSKTPSRAKTPLSGDHSHAPASAIRSRDSMASGVSSMAFDDIAFSSRRSGPGSVTGDNLTFASIGGMEGGIGSPKGSSGPTRTSSLIRPSGPTAVSGLRRKPSIQTESLQAAQPAMSREQVSAMSHAQREENRAQAEHAIRLRSNPLLYLIDPRFMNWLSRQKLILTILVLNVGLAALFYQMFG